MLAVSCLHIITNQMLTYCYDIAMDFTAVSEVLVFSPNISRVCVNISIEDDELVEIDEDFSVSLSSSDFVTIHPNSSKDIIILDNDGMNLMYNRQIEKGWSSRARLAKLNYAWLTIVLPHSSSVGVPECY